jgi:hypothetical protein
VAGVETPLGAPQGGEVVVPIWDEEMILTAMSRLGHVRVRPAH